MPGRQISNHRQMQKTRGEYILKSMLGTMTESGWENSSHMSFCLPVSTTHILYHGGTGGMFVRSGYLPAVLQGMMLLHS